MMKMPRLPNDQANPTGEIIRLVQLRLLELGYSSGGPPDGVIGFKTEAAILNFKNRNRLWEYNLADKRTYSPAIDNRLLEALETASPVELPLEQVVARTEDISPKVQAVKETWYTRFWAKVLALPSLIVAVATGIISNLGEAVTLIYPLKEFANDHLSRLEPLTIVLISALVTSFVALIIWLKSSKAEEALVEGYRQGTVRNDNPYATRGDVE